MSSESYKKFIENLTAHCKIEDAPTAYEKFGNKTKNQKRKMTRENTKILTSAPRTLDLHGFTVAESEKLVLNFCIKNPGSTVVIITGRSGKLRELFPTWADGFLKPYISGYKLMPTGGSWEIILRKRMH